MRPFLDRLLPATVTPPASAAAAQPSSASSAPTVHRVDSIVGLRHLAAVTGDVAYVAGYFTPGDGGAMTVRWDATSTQPDDGGFAFEGKRTKKRQGRWLQLHDGVGDFRRFGIFDASVAADDALDAMVTNPAVHRVEGHTDLNFVRRHVFTRSNVEIDFGGRLVTSEGIERNSHDNPFGAVLFFQGERTAETVTRTLTAAMPELVDVFEVDTSGAFSVGQWWTATVNSLTGADERELQLLVQVTQIVDGSHIRVNYKNGWPFDVGRIITWVRVNPVENVSVRNMQFLGSGPFEGPDDGSFPDDREMSGSHPVAFEFAVRCDVADIHGSKTWWPVIMRRWCTFFRTERSSLENPPTVFYGGAGYLTQQIYCLYGHITDCHTSNARHLNDLTASAYCIVKNCHGDGDDAGGNPFTTHGQYEHDLLFEGNSGLMDIANSGGQWGTSAKRITVRKHVCSWFVASTKITDLTLEDVKVVPRSTFDVNATLTVNADGVQMRGCSARFFAIGQRSARSSRPNVIEDCTFELPPATVVVQTPVTQAVHFVRCTISGFDGAIFRGPGDLRFTGCTLVGAEGGASASMGSADIAILASTLRNAAIELSAVRDQRLVLDAGTTVTGTTGGAAFFSRLPGAGALTWQLGAADLTASTPQTTHVALAAGTNSFHAVGTRFTGGLLTLAAGGFGPGSSLLLSRCIERGVVRDVPMDSATTTQSFSLQTS